MDKTAEVLQQKARINHFCADCGKPILRGCEYLKITWREGRKICHLKEHIHCDAVIAAYCVQHGCDMAPDKLDAVVKWLVDTVCINCKYGFECPLHGQELFSCRTILQSVLPPTFLGAALKSAHDNREGIAAEE